MGLFSSKKTYVSSVLYNLAGPEEDRANYKKTLVVGTILTSSNFSMSDTITDGYQRGPGLKLRSFYRWAELNYSTIGVPSGTLRGSADANSSVFETEIPHPGDKTVMVQTVEEGRADYTYWATQWVLENQPELLDTDWSADSDEASGDITITFEDTSTTTFSPVNFDRDGLYLYVTYTLVGGVEDLPAVIGDTIEIDEGGSFPPSDDYAPVSDSSSPVSVETKTTTRVRVYESPYPDPISDVTTTSNHQTHSGTAYEWVKVKSDYMGQHSSTDAIYTRHLRLHQEEYPGVKETTTTSTVEEDLGGGNIRVTVTDTTTEEVITKRRYRIDIIDTLNKSWGDAKLFIYKIGSGNPVLDAFLPSQISDGGYMPFIPLRLDNQFLSVSYLPTAYEASKKAYKKVTGAKYDELRSKIASNEDIGDIDYAYVMFGVSLNVEENAARKYLYLLFDRLREAQLTSNTDYTDWLNNRDHYDAQLEAWTEWKLAQSNPSDPLYNTPEPSRPGFTSTPENRIVIRGNGSIDTNVDMSIKWNAIYENSGTGLKEPGRKAGELWFTQGGVIEGGEEIIYTKGGVVRLPRENEGIVTLNWQVDSDNWKSLTLVGLVHENMIYNRKSVVITAVEALNDTEESGFLVPIHYTTFRSMSLVDATQMATACMFIVFNCYQVVKKKWFQTGIFKIVLIVAVIAVTVATGGLGGGSVGLLGTNLSVGAALGFSGLAATIAGAIANAVAAMLVFNIVSGGLSAALGDKIGSIVGTIAALVTLQVGTALFNGNSLATIWGNMMSAPNILDLTNAAGRGVAGYIQASAMETATEAQTLMEEYAEQASELSKLYAENIGYGRGVIDPISLTDVNFGNSTETFEQFAARTLMTGSDVAEMSLDMLSNFAKYTLTTELPIVR